MPTTDLERDALDIIEFFVALADQDAVLVSHLLTAAGLEPGTGLPRDPLLKLALYCRLALWEHAGLVTPDDELPSADSVFRDALAELEGRRPHFDIVALGHQVHFYALGRLTWPQISGAPSFLLDDQADSTDVLDGIAELLWTYRHLAEPTTSASGPTQQPREASTTKGESLSSRNSKPRKRTTRGA